ncbi:MAG: hydrogenase maturation nickel metallochaperone HypA [Anaerolineae bacterium]|nr:hydrogenase maturation nickel metallochaperone HypA [Anaerolineae bacterium]
MPRIVHELGVTQSILEIALRHARQAGAARIREVNLVIGELSSIVDDSVQFYWDMISEGTIGHGAVLTFTRIPATLRCQDCEHEFPLNHHDYACPVCGSSKVVVADGEQFYLESIDVDLAEPQPGL